LNELHVTEIAVAGLLGVSSAIIPKDEELKRKLNSYYVFEHYPSSCFYLKYNDLETG
jgi:hypothetical protein